MLSACSIDYCQAYLAAFEMQVIRWRSKGVTSFYCANYNEGSIGYIKSGRKPAGENTCQAVNGDQVDDEGVASPRGHLQRPLLAYSVYHGRSGREAGHCIYMVSEQSK